ncbi:MAG: XisI protein [Deltaproteobacteria bacterium]|nr:MAG: XisI protein [Deltaproteobacteria bacterium]
MDQVGQYGQILEELLNVYAQKPSHGDIETEVIIDRNGKHFELMHVGWHGTRRVHGSVLHIDIIDGKIWVQHDGTSPGIALDLVEAGVPREDIVLGFRPPEVRPYTDFGTAK